jgi:hypothetical protein
MLSPKDSKAMRCVVTATVDQEGAEQARYRPGSE